MTEVEIVATIVVYNKKVEESLIIAQVISATKNIVL